MPGEAHRLLVRRSLVLGSPSGEGRLFIGRWHRPREGVQVKNRLWHRAYRYERLGEIVAQPLGAPPRADR